VHANADRAIQSVLNRSASVLAHFNGRHAADGFITVSQYWALVQDRVELIDLRDRVPAFNLEATTPLDAASILGTA
jgi:hypothetical protein